MQHGLRERDANEAVAALERNGLDAAVIREDARPPTWAVAVTRDSAADARAILAELRLPRAGRATTRDILLPTGLIDTPSAERGRTLEAHEGDLEETLETMDGVIGASVEIAVPLAARPGEMTLPTKAAVLLRIDPNAVERIARAREEVKALVAAATVGLKQDDVVLITDVVTLQRRRERTPEATTAWRATAALAALAVGALGIAALWQRRRKPRAQPVINPAIKAG